MPAYSYTAITDTGIKKKGILSANSEREARRLVKDLQLTPLKIYESKDLGKALKIKNKDIVIMTRQLATLLEANTPIVDAIEITANQLTNKNQCSKIINACTDITGFGLLGHLSEMLESTNRNQLKMNLEPLKIILELDNIPVYDGVKELLDKGFESTLSPANEIFLKNNKENKDLRFELISNVLTSNKSVYKNMLKILVDPQTCGPLVVSCSSIHSEKLIQEGPWIKIGFVS